MKCLTVAHAGCDAATVEKLTLAARLFRERDLELLITPWQDAGADIVITCPADPFGLKITDLARQRHLPLLTISLSEDYCLDHSLSVGRRRPAFDYFLALEQLMDSHHPITDSGSSHAVHSHSIVAGGFDEIS